MNIKRVKEAVGLKVLYLDINDDPLHVDAHEAGGNLEDAV
jgi:hypothetical protein